MCIVLKVFAAMGELTARGFCKEFLGFTGECVFSVVSLMAV